MNITQQFGMQGDTQWFSIDSIPSNAKKVEKQFIAASERSGSFHCLFGEYDMYETDGGFIIDAHEECILNHSLKEVLDRSRISLSEAKVLEKKDHRHSVIPKGKYIVGIQNRFNPMEGFLQRVKD